jgi:hypothetical protein
VRLLTAEIARILPTARVFVDTAGLDPGDDFPALIASEISSSHAVLVVIGPHWSVDRLWEPRDMVRHEIELARHRPRVIPILHGGASIPGPGNLPAEIAWLSDTNAMAFMEAARLDQDVARLVASLVATVEAVWEEHAERPSPAAADCYRLLGVAMIRAGRRVERHIWWARSISAAYRSGGSNALGAALLPIYFTLVADDRPLEAREILAEIARLLDPDDDGQLPTGGVMRRMYHEKLAFALYVEGRVEEAIDGYRRAADLAGDDARGCLKSRAGSALCSYRLGRHADAIAATVEFSGVRRRTAGRTSSTPRDATSM